MRSGNQPRIIFVAHSMGGLVVKKAFILAHQEPEFQPIAQRICSLFFLATPHQGAAIAQTLARLLTMVGARPFVDDLLPQSPLLQAINEEFPRHSAKVQLMSFYETRAMSIGVNKSIIVEKNSAVMNLANERRTLLDADHRNVAMYASPDDPSYLTVRNALATAVSLQRDWSNSFRKRVAQDDQLALSKFLGVYDAPEDDIMTHDSVRLPGSCEWLMNREFYCMWREAMDTSFLWLRGRPGAGKSVLSGRIVNDLRDRGLDVCFFFFQGRDSAKSSLNACLRSIAWQMATIHLEVMEKMKELMDEWREGSLDKIDTNPIWRKIFLSGILKVRLSRPQFWVIDSLDECKESADIITYLARIQDQWPLSILVTSRDALEAHLNSASLHVDIQSHTISDRDTVQDINILLKANINHLPCPTSSRWSTPWDMAKEIVDRSAGCFLWATLICSELRQATSEREIEKIMESTPANMDDLYFNILVDMENARFGKETAKAFITWTTYAFRPLSTAEMQVPIEMDINDKLDNVERTISKCCGSLIYVDRQDKIHLVHSTAREFLTRKGVESEFTMSKAEGHRRLAIVCLRFLTQDEQKYATRGGRLASEPERRSRTRSRSPSSTKDQSSAFTQYASTFLFQHLNHIHSSNEEVFLLLSKFLGSPSFLRWVEFIATDGDLRTIYQAGKTINSLVNRRAQHSPPLGLARRQDKFALLEKWGDDLIYLVTKFSGWLRRYPNSIHHLIPPFCPPDSALSRQFANPYRGLTVQGMSDRSWDDCLTTINYPKGTKPNAVAAGPGFFAVGMLSSEGTIIVYDDSIFQEAHVLRHGEAVWTLAFSDNGNYLASAGAKTVRIWSPTEGTEIANFKIGSLCLSMAFVDEDTVLRVATRQNQLIDWDIDAKAFFHEEPVTWTGELDDTMQFRTPMLASLGPTSHLLAVLFRGENTVIWDCAEDRIYDIYEKNTGSVYMFPSEKIPRGSTTVRAATFSHALDSNMFAATYSDGDLVVYDTERGEPIAFREGTNAMVLASSNDGRTLAGVDSQGSVTLFEFETLRPLYRVQFDTPVLPKGLAFTADDYRFIEIRGSQCRVWEPSVLLRSDLPDDDNSDTLSVSTSPQEVEHHTTRTSVVEISAVACCHDSNVVFCGMTDGSVHAYDIAGLDYDRQKIFIQTQGSPVDFLFIHESSGLLLCGDRSGRVTARHVFRRNAPRQKNNWDIDSKLLVDAHTSTKDLDLLKQVLVSVRNSRLLMATDKQDTLWPIPTQGEGVWVTQVDRDNSRSPRWISPLDDNSEHLLRLGMAGETIEVYKWSTLEMVHSVSLKLDMGESIRRFAGFRHPQYFATLSKSPEMKSGMLKGQAKNIIRLWNFEAIEKGPDSIAPASNLRILPPSVELVIGVFGSRLIVFTSDHWIASLDLESPHPSPGSSVDGTLVRHFFLPNDLVGSMPIHRLMFDIGRGGEITLVRRSELLVIKRGLEITESGTSFNPRRGGQLRIQRGGRMPFRHRGT